MTRTFFFNENSKNSTIKRILGNVSSELVKYIDTITKMTNGNKIGYFQFQYEDVYYKFYIMPKIYKVEEKECDACEAYKEQFIKFFKHYYRLVGKYDIEKYSDTLDGNISDLSYSSQETAKELVTDVESVDDFIVHNYDDSLFVIERFFTKHKKQILVDQNFQSQSIKSKIDIRRNMIELNKSSVHQTRKVPMIYSNIAVIAMEVLHHFIDTKVRNFSATTKSKVLKRRANKIQNTLKQKFSNNHDLTFKINELLQRKTSKLFEKNNEYKILYKALLKLTGKEHYYNGDVYREIQKEDEMISIFFQPEKLYEWILYDELIEKDEYDEVLKDDKDNISKNYFLYPRANNANFTSKHISKPDLIVTQGSEQYIVDAKWKVLDKDMKHAEFYNDVAKLRRDAKIRNAMKGYLIYPKYDESSKYELDVEYKYDFDDFIFELKVVNVV